jgi:hypothetical protein
MRIAIAGWNNITVDIEKELVKRGHFLTPNFKKADAIVVWNELVSLGNDKIVLDAQKRGANTVLLQHGFRGVSRIHAPFNDPLLSRRACVWGQGDVERLVGLGVPRDRIVVTGNPILRYLKPRVKHEGINVVYGPEHWDGNANEVPENFIVASALRKIKGINVITKLLVGENNPSMYDNPVYSDRAVRGHMEIVADVLSQADVVVAIKESTFSLLAEILDIPVIIADIWVPKACMGDEAYRNFPNFFTNACARVKDLSKLEEAIKFAVKHPEHLREERKKIGIFEGGTDHANPVEEIIKVIEEHV